MANAAFRGAQVCPRISHIPYVIEVPSVEPSRERSGIDLTEQELLRLIECVAGAAPAHRLVATLQRGMAAKPHLFVDLVGCLLLGGPRSLAALAELALTEPENAPSWRGVFRREGEYWTIIYDGAVVRLRDSKGLAYLAQLLRRPGERVLASDLVAGAAAGSIARPRSEQARLTVTKALKGVLARLRDCHPTLASHLGATLRSGRACSYTPDPRQAIRWETGDSLESHEPVA